MSVLGSIFKWIGALLKKVVSMVGKVLKKIWPILLLIAVIYFAPFLTGYLTSIGAPGFLTSALSAVATNVTPLLTSAIAYVSSGAATVGSTAWAAFKTAEISTQAALVLGTSLLIAPEETAGLIGDAANAVGEVVGQVGGGLVSGVFGGSGTLMLFALGAAAYFLLFPSNNERSS